MRFFHILIAEFQKAHKHHFHSKMIYFSLFLWPILLFIVSYYSFKPFNLEENSPLSKYIEVDQLGLFLLTGFLAYTFFWCLVQSAWQMSYERSAGTLELIFLTPVSRIMFIYGRAAANLFEATWLFTLFTLLAIFFITDISSIHWINVPFSFVLLSISAIVWGGFLNILFLFSRDSTILFTVLEEPMMFFSGVRIPVLAFPLWGKVIAFAFPLTYVLDIFRDLVIKGVPYSELTNSFLILTSILIVLILVSIWLLNKAENHAKNTGNMVLF